MIEYEPREGVDYIIDYYQLIGLEQGADQQSVKDAVRGKLKEYHPDRMQGLAPELIEKGERMTALLGRANSILNSPDSRGEYDVILSSWEGPISEDGIPIVSAHKMNSFAYGGMTPEEIETDMSAYSKLAATHHNHDPHALEFYEELVEQNPIKKVRDRYDFALLAEDRLLGLDQSNRARTIGVDDNSFFDGFGDAFAGELEEKLQEAENKQRELFGTLEAGATATKLALMAGESAPTSPPISSTLELMENGLPSYHAAQTESIHDITTRRQEILQKRLANIDIVYPEKDQQPDEAVNFIIGYQHERTVWVAFSFNSDEEELAKIECPEEIESALDTANFNVAFEAGFSVMTFKHLQGIDPMTLLTEVANRHIDESSLRAEQK